jgi:hypothetical protein
MPLQQLVEYFNDRFGLEHQSSFRPILLESGKASGLFGPVRINSNFLPLRQPNKPEAISGYFAQLEVVTYDPLLLKHQQIERLAEGPPTHANSFDAYINFDRLTRTVHMLNYLPMSHLGKTLFVEVDPQHILSVKKDHGAYFEEIIIKCGLQTQNVVIVTTIQNYAENHYKQLHNGLDNYRSRGYQIGLRVNYRPHDDLLESYIRIFTPNYVCLSSRNIEETPIKDQWLSRLQQIKSYLQPVAGKIVLSGVQEKKFAQLAVDCNIDLVEGNYYRTIAFDYLNHLKPNGQQAANISYQ